MTFTLLMRMPRFNYSCSSSPLPVYTELTWPSAPPVTFPLRGDISRRKTREQSAAASPGRERRQSRYPRVHYTRGGRSARDGRTPNPATLCVSPGMCAGAALCGHGRQRVGHGHGATLAATTGQTLTQLPRTSGQTWTHLPRTSL